MAFFEALKEEMQQFATLLKTVSGTQNTALGANFRKFGPSFGAYDYEDFVELAQKFYHEAMNSDDSSYSVVRLGDGRIAIDCNAEIRAVYDKDGTPIAFFRPDFKQLGYQNKVQELEDFRNGTNIAYS